MLDDMSWNRIARYALRECDAAEAIETQAWIQADPERKAVAEQLMKLVDANPTRVWDARAAWERFSTSAPERPRVLPSSTRSVQRRRLAPRVAIAATIVAMIGGALIWRMQQSSPTSQVAQWHEVTTQVAQRASLRLGDGTEVMLAPESGVRYAADFGKQQRDVYLEGEAYFVVTHDEERPFRVHTRNGIAEDLGTAFVVRDYAEQSATEVVVTEGRVALDTLQLEPGDLGRVDARGQTTVQHNVNVDRYLAWTHGALVFDGTPLREVVRTLERWYGVTIELTAEDAAGLPLTVTFRNKSAVEVMERIAFIVDLEVERHDGSFTLKHKAP